MLFKNSDFFLGKKTLRGLFCRFSFVKTDVPVPGLWVILHGPAQQLATWAGLLILCNSHPVTPHTFAAAAVICLAFMTLFPVFFLFDKVVRLFISEWPCTHKVT